MRMADNRVCRWSELCFGFIVLLSLCCGFNLDPRFAVIKKGPENSYFGYSVSEHQIVSGDRITENLILVGAPKQQRKVGNSVSGGAIYKCNASSTLETDCLVLDAREMSSSSLTDDVSDQWLGVVLQSFGKGGKIVTCAHRFIQNNAALGICHTLNQELQHESPWFPCLGKSHVNFLEDFGLCQAGVSAVIGQEDSMVMGAPGSVFWRGVMFMVNISDSIEKSYTTFNTPVPVNTNEEGAATALAPPTDKYSYLGYSTAVGKFDATKKLYFVSGAPRSNEKGEVVIFNLVDLSKQDLYYKPEQKLVGERDFAGFGSSLLSMDLNNDGFDDLIVGAPYYYESGYGGAVYVYLGGRNLIKNTSVPTKILSRKMSDAECIQLGCEHARFGISLAKLGDVNHDGYQDFAVGAPYEGNGTVYIYHGSQNGVVEMFAQRIPASDMPNGAQFQSFGSSLSGGLDLDSNGYPDLLVGSYETSQVALIRARAIIRLSPVITVSPKMIDLEQAQFCPFNKAQKRCVQLKICLRFTAEPSSSFQEGPLINYRVDAERSRSFSRLELVNSTDASKKFAEGSVKLNSQASRVMACIDQLAYLKDVFADKLNPMELTVTFSQNEPSYTWPKPGEKLPDINKYPILSTVGAVGTEPNTVSEMVDFVKECGDDNLCHSNLTFEARLAQPMDEGKYLVRVGDKVNTLLNVTITNLGEAAYLTRVFVQKPPLMDYQGVSGEGQDSAVKCNPKPVGVNDDTLIVCDDIGNPLKQRSSVTFSIRLSTNRLQATDKTLNITVWVNTSSTEQTPQNDLQVFLFTVILETNLVVSSNVRPDDQILCAGEPRGASAMKSETDIGAAVNHTYIVSNRGNNNVTRSTLTIMWPYEVGGGQAGQGKYLLYLMENPIIEKGRASCSVEEKDTVNPLQIKAVEPQAAPVTVDRVQSLDRQARRRKRATESETRVKRSQGNWVELGCTPKTAQCRKITCILPNLEEKVGYVQITLRARLWESTLLQDYRRVGDVKISSYAFVEIDPALRIKEDQSDNKAEAVTYAVPDFKDSGTQQVAWWVILLAVLGGIVLLAIIIFILYKIGFFRRKRPEEMQMYQAEKKEQKMLDDVDDDDK